MTKQQMAKRIASILANGDSREESRLYRYHMTRPVSAVRETLARWQMIAAVTPAEIRRHCDVSFIR